MKIHDITMLIHKDMPVYKNKEDKTKASGGFKPLNRKAP